jgi:hypothetical protein
MPYTDQVTVLDSPKPDDPKLTGIVAVMTASEVGRWTAVWECLAETLWPPDSTVARIKVVTYDVTDGRNQALTYAKAQGVEWCWLIDDDQSWDADLLLKLLARNVDLVQPLTLQRFVPFLPIAFKESGWTEERPRYLTLDPGLSGLVKVSSMGGGCLLVRRKVWETLPPPWFESGKVVKGKHAEDTFFCLRAGDAGFPCYVDTDHVSRHWVAGTVEPYRRKDGTWATRFSVYERPLFDLPAAVEVAPHEYQLGKAR